MNWLNEQDSLYSTHADNIGRPATFRDILLCDFGRDLSTIIELRKLDRTAPDYDTRKKELKAKLQCFTPAALLATKAKGKLKEIKRTGIMQLDFDYKDIQDYDVEELKQAVFALPFIAFCGLSVSGDGFYALAAIAEPHRLSDYAEHCFQVFEEYGIKADTSKGKKPENLRYVSYDQNMLIRENPTPLHIKQFKAKKKPYNPSKGNTPTPARYAQEGATDKRIINGLDRIRNATNGSRFNTVQSVAYTLGGLGAPELLNQVKEIIQTSPHYADEVDKFLKCAEVQFKDGMLKPI